MGWQVLIPLIAQYGLPLVEKLWALWSTKADPTQADWDTLKALAATTAQQQAVNALIRNGVDPSSPQGVALLALVG